MFLLIILKEDANCHVSGTCDGWFAGWLERPVGLMAGDQVAAGFIGWLAGWLAG